MTICEKSYNGKLPDKQKLNKKGSRTIQKAAEWDEWPR
jgi:hypothetical protein